AIVTRLSRRIHVAVTSVTHVSHGFADTRMHGDQRRTRDGGAGVPGAPARVGAAAAGRGRVPRGERRLPLARDEAGGHRGPGRDGGGGVPRTGGRTTAGGRP